MISLRRAVIEDLDFLAYIDLKVDGRFLEVFQLWVHPNYRRQGLATQLKKKVEEEARFHEVNLIYTHTEESNNHVIELNRRLGYQEVRRGLIWDNVIRVSLIKHLEQPKG